MSAASGSATPDASVAARWFPWIVWLVALLGTLALVAHFSRNVPRNEDFTTVPVLTGEQPVTWAWLWSQNNEHRVPLPRLLYLGLFMLSGRDFRAAMYFNVLALGMLAAAALWTAERTREQPRYSDAFLVLVFLQWGQIENYLWSWQVQFVTATVLTGVLLLIIVRNKSMQQLAICWPAGLCLLLLPLCGASGYPLVPLFAPWLAYCALRGWAAAPAGDRLRRSLLFGLVVAAVGLALFYLVGYERRLTEWHGRTLANVLTAGGGFLSMSFGPLFLTSWPGWALLMLALLAGAAGLLLYAAWKDASERPRVLGLLLFLAGYLALVLAIGWGRGALQAEGGLKSRYSTLSAPMLAWLYLVVLLYAGRHGLARGVPAVLALLGAVMAIWATPDALRYSREFCQRRTELEADLRAGRPRFFLVERYAYDPFGLLAYDPDALPAYLTALREAQVGEFRYMADDPPFREVALFPGKALNIRGAGGFSLKESTRVYAFRATCLCRGSSPPTTLTIRWSRKNGDRGLEGDASGFSSPLDPLKPEPLVVWVNDVVDHFQLALRSPAGALRVSEIVLYIDDNPRRTTPDR